LVDWKDVHLGMMMAERKDTRSEATKGPNLAGWRAGCCWKAVHSESTKAETRVGRLDSMMVETMG